MAFAFLAFSLVVDFGVRVMPGGDEGGGEEHGVSKGRWLPPRGLRAVALLPDLRVHGSEVRSRRPAGRRRRSGGDRGSQPAPGPRFGVRSRTCWR